MELKNIEVESYLWFAGCDMYPKKLESVYQLRLRHKNNIGEEFEYFMQSMKMYP